jgi:ferredoxin-type protein NapG
MDDQENVKTVALYSSLSRRAAMRLGAQGLVVVGLGGLIRLLPRREEVLRPPGALPERQFLAHCIKCQRCMEVCPTGAIWPVFLAESVVGAGTPKLDFRRGYCDLCMKCTRVCPTRALEPTSKEATRLGLAQIDRDKCVAWVMQGCLRCYSVCPLEAIVLVDGQWPTINPSRCNGCGLCEYVCPSPFFRSYAGSPGRAIVVAPVPPTET